jgi:hypothetical protein
MIVGSSGMGVVMAGWGRPRFAAVPVLVVVLGVSGFSARGASASGGVRLVPAAGAGTAAASGGWGRAVTVRGAAKLSISRISEISCSLPGNCGAAGSFYQGQHRYEALVVSQVRGAWGKATDVPGTARTRRPNALASAIACPSAGGCVVAGSYTDGAGNTQAFIASQVRGTWHKIIWVPGLGGLNRGNNASLSDISCPSAGNCAATGSYTDAAGNGQPFIVTEADGNWGAATPVPGLAALPGLLTSRGAGTGPVSCASPGNCAAVGGYPAHKRGDSQSYLVNEVNGTWGQAMPVPGLSALNTGLDSAISAISCPSPGNCGAGGRYADSGGTADSFVVSETGGTWGTAIEVPGTSHLNRNDGDWITTISCPSAGNCAAGGPYDVDSDATTSQVFLVSQTNGTWGKAFQVPGTSELNHGRNAWINQVSCSSAGNCGAAGYYSPAHDGIPRTQPFVLNQVHGRWDRAIEVPGSGKLNTSANSNTTAISCTATDRCSAGGYYHNRKTGPAAFADSQPAPPPCAGSTVIAITHFAFNPRSIPPGQSSTATLTALNCTDKPQQASDSWYARFTGPDGGMLPGCPVIDPLPPFADNFPPHGTVSNRLSYSVPQQCTATQLIVTAGIYGNDDIVLAQRNATLQIKTAAG